MNRLTIKLTIFCISLTLISLMLAFQSYAKLDPETIAGMWLFDEGSGETAEDSSGNENDGTLINNAEWVEGKFGQALDFDGVNAYVNIPNSDSLNPTEEITLSALIKPSDVTSFTYIEIMRQESGDQRKLFSFQLNGTQLSLGLNTAGSYWETDFPITAKDYTDGEWHHVAYTYDGSQAILYVDGELDNSQDRSGDIAVAVVPLMIGSSAGSGEFFIGLIDEVAMFNVALAEQDIQDIANLGLKQAVTAVDLSGKLSTTWAAIKAQ